MQLALSPLACLAGMQCVGTLHQACLGVQNAVDDTHRHLGRTGFQIADCCEKGPEVHLERRKVGVIHNHGHACQPRQVVITRAVIEDPGEGVVAQQKAGNDEETVAAYTVDPVLQSVPGVQFKADQPQ
ncbi:hypothetical protein D3C77_605070 [compost metagenome]